MEKCVYLLTFFTLDILQDEAHRFTVDNVQQHGFDFIAIKIRFTERTFPHRSENKMKLK